MTTAQGELFQLADELKRLRDLKDRLNEGVSEANERITEIERQLSDLMAEQELVNFTRAGTMYYLSTKTRASAAEGCKEQLHNALKENG